MAELQKFLSQYQEYRQKCLQQITTQRGSIDERIKSLNCPELEQELKDLAAGKTPFSQGSDALQHAKAAVAEAAVTENGRSETGGRRQTQIARD